VNLSLIIPAAVVLIAVAALVVWRQPVLAFGQRSNAFLNNVRGEMRKVSWPSWDDLRRSTVVITIIVIVIGIIIGLMDWIFSKILIDLFGRIFGG
jgi:preprotein translocase subunit SecE